MITQNTQNENSMETRFLVVSDKKVYNPIEKLFSLDAQEKGYNYGVSFPDLKRKKYKQKDEIKLRIDIYGKSFPLIRVNGVFSFPEVRKIEGEVLEKLKEFEQKIKIMQDEKANFLKEVYENLNFVNLDEVLRICLNNIDKEEWKNDLKQRIKNIIKRKYKIDYEIK